MATPLVLSFIASLLPSTYALEAISSILPGELLIIEAISQSVSQPVGPSIGEETRMLLSSACSFMMILVFLILSHEPTSPFTLPGDRPHKLIKLSRKSVRLGHRVGPKQGRKLSAVNEEDEPDQSFRAMSQFNDQLSTLFNDLSNNLNNQSINQTISQTISHSSSQFTELMNVHSKQQCDSISEE